MGKNHIKLFIFSLWNALFPITFAHKNGLQTVDIAPNETIHSKTVPTADIIKDFLKKIHYDATDITPGEVIGEGGFGTVFKTKHNGVWIIIKQPKTEKATRGMKAEYDRTQAMFESIRKLIDNPNPDDLCPKLSGLPYIVPVIGKTPEGGVIQEYADGANLLVSSGFATAERLRTQITHAIGKILSDAIDADARDTLDGVVYKVVQENLEGSSGPTVKKNLIVVVDEAIKQQLGGLEDSAAVEQFRQAVHTIITESRCDIYDARGFPRDPRAAMEALRVFFRGLLALHALQYVHCDIKPENIIFTKDNLLRIIDLGGLTPIGEKITTRSRNGAPETLYSVELQIEKIGDAQTAYDIYSSAGVLLVGLFGDKGIDADCRCFCCNTQKVVRELPSNKLTLRRRRANRGKGTKKDEKILENAPPYVQRIAQKDFRNDTNSIRTTFLGDMLDALNEEMGQPGPDGTPHKNYPPNVLGIIKEILIKATEPDPKNRLSAEDILKKLQETMRLNWDIGK